MSGCDVSISVQEARSSTPCQVESRWHVKEKLTSIDPALKAVQARAVSTVSLNIAEPQLFAATFCHSCLGRKLRDEVVWYSISVGSWRRAKVYLHSYFKVLAGQPS